MVDIGTLATHLTRVNKHTMAFRCYIADYKILLAFIKLEGSDDTLSSKP